MKVLCSGHSLPSSQRISRGLLNLHQYHTHLSASTLASHPTLKSSPAHSLLSSTRLHQLNRHFFTQSPPHATMGSYTTRKTGAPFTLEHRIYIEKDGVVVSPFHDIPLYANEQQTVLNMIVEIPRWTNAKMEVREHQLAHGSSIQKLKLIRVLCQRSRRRNH